MINKKLTLIILVSILVFAFWIRSYKLTQSPPGFYLDETSNAYNAYSILKTGKDEYSVKLPIFFKSFGDYRGGVFIYSLVPLIKWRGLNIETIRLGASIWGTTAVLGIFLLTKLITKDNLLSLISAVILTLMPWHIHFSRIAHESITLPVAIETIFICWIMWFKTQRFRWSIILIFVFWLSFFTYQTAKFWIPLLAGLIIIIYQLFKAKNWKKLLPWLIGGELIILSVFFFEKAFPGSFMARMNQLSIWRDQPTFWEIIRRFANNFTNHWQWQFLFGGGDQTYRSSSTVGSELLTSWVIFFIIGLFTTINKARTQAAWRIVLLLIIFFPLAASLTITGPHAIRTIQTTPFFALIIGLGIWQCLKLLKKRKFLLILFIIISIGSIGIEFRHYYLDLINEYPKRVAMPQHGFDAQLGPAIKKAYQESQKQNKKLFLSDKIEQAYIQGLFFTRADPRLWQINRLAPFIVAEFKTIKPSEIWVITKEECPQKNKDYCVLSD